MCSTIGCGSTSRIKAVSSSLPKLQWFGQTLCLDLPLIMMMMMMIWALGCSNKAVIWCPFDLHLGPVILTVTPDKLHLILNLVSFLLVTIKDHCTTVSIMNDIAVSLKL